MRRKNLLELLSLHADALNEDRDDTDLLLARYPSEREKLQPLFALASAAKQALIPIEPEEAFVTMLAEDLSTLSTPKVTERKRQTQPQAIGIVAATVGSVLSIVGVILLWRRRMNQRTQAMSSAA